MAGRVDAGSAGRAWSAVTCGPRDHSPAWSCARRESLPDLLSAVKILAGSTVEIAAASVSEANLVNAVMQMEDGKAQEALEPTEGAQEPNLKDTEAANDKISEVVTKHTTIGEEAAQSEAGEATVAAAKVELESEEAPNVIADPSTLEMAGTKEGEGPPDQEVITEKTAVAVAEEEKEQDTAVPPSEGATVAAIEAEEVGGAEAEAEAPVPEAAPDEVVSTEEAMLEKAIPIEVDTLDEESVPLEEEAPAEKSTNAEPAVEGESVEAPAAAPSAEEAVETDPVPELATQTIDTIQLAAASPGSDLEVFPAAEPEPTSEEPMKEMKETKQCHSCHASAAAGEEAAVPPAAQGENVQMEVQLTWEEAIDLTEKGKEEVALVKGETTESKAVVAAGS